MPDTIRFVGNDSAGFPLKRKQSQRACEACRRRKKRCVHQSSSGNHELITASIDRSSPPVPQISSIASSSRFPDDERSTPSMYSSRSGNVANDLSIESASLTAINKPTVAFANEIQNAPLDEEDQNPRFVGELNPEATFVTSAESTTSAVASSPKEIVGIWVPKRLASRTETLSGPLIQSLLPHLEEECSRALPKPADFEVIFKLYNEDFHPILPVINLDSYYRQKERPKTLLKLAMCLCVSSNSKALPYLTQSSKYCTTQVTQLLRSMIDNGLVEDKQIIIQLLIILALSTQLSEDRHASAEFTCRAVSYIHTGGLHLDTTSRDDNLYITRLFCCTFALDRLNAAIQGRPVLMHERDFGRDLAACITQQDSLFQLHLRIILLLDRIIALYRPPMHHDDAVVLSGGDYNTLFPAFEDLLSQCGTIRVPAALVATVETLYHAVSMLSYRSQARSELSRSSASYTRQNLSAANIISIAGSEYRGQLSILPFVPYSLSLALRVSYRDLRQSKSSFTRTRSRRQLLHICTLLQELGDAFPSSLHMASLAKQTVREMDKAYSNVLEQRRGSVAGAAVESGHNETQQASITQAQEQKQHEKESRHGNSDHFQLFKHPKSSASMEKYDLQTFNPAELDFDFDIFDYFDPHFDIHAIDAALVDFIDPSAPVNMP